MGIEERRLSMGGFAAARITDQSAHGGLVSVGCPTVLINNLPASRIGDMHTCPMVTGIVPHVGGPFVLGAFTVIVGGVPQSRVMDTLVCVGPPDTLVKGSPNVNVGMAGGGGGLGAILGGLFAGLLHFLSPYPKAVLQPDGTIATEYSPAITIKGTAQFQAQVLARLNLIANTKSGQKTLQAINNSKKSMTIIAFAGNNSFCGANRTWADVAGQTPNGKPVCDGSGNPVMGPDGTTPLVGTGKGADTTLQFNPNLTLANSKDPSNPMPNDAVLMHEMTHGAHMMNGQADMSKLGGGWTTQEEKTTISDGSPSEAEYLEERGYPYHRTDHDSTFADN
jgi:uncharacterized Zn-binding protein involved in type VI secretion